MKDPSTPRSTSYDVIVAGAGVVGLACAWRAARDGHRVCVLERGRIGSGASGVAAGMLAPVGEASWGEEALLALGLESLHRWDEFADELAGDSAKPAGYRRIGALHLALDRDEAEALTRRYELHRDLGLASERLTPSQARALEPSLSPSVTAALHAPDEGAADPVVVSAALATAVRARGGEVAEQTEITGLEIGGDGATVSLAGGGEVACRRLVVATGAWSGSAEWLPEELRPPVRPVKGEILTLRARAGEAPCERILAHERIYLVPRKDGRLIAGATVEERGFDETVTAGGVHEILREAYRLLPEVAELELVEARARLRPGTPDNRPVIGAVGPIVLATGHYRNGILLAPATADAVAAIIRGDEPGIDAGAFGPGRFGLGAQSARQAAAR
jgi:glycine oxidase